LSTGHWDSERRTDAVERAGAAAAATLPLAGGVIATIAAKALAASDSPWAPAVLAAAIAGGVAVFTWAVGSIISTVQRDRQRRREAFSRAFAAIVAYAEFPYEVRRRDPGDEAGERLRISEALRTLQQEISYFEAWLRSESSAVGEAYADLVADTRRLAGKAIHDAWLAPAVAADADMNMPDLGLAPLQQSRTRYLAAVAKDPFFAEIQEVYEEIGEGLPPDAAWPKPGQLQDDRAEIEATGLFEDVRVRQFDWELTYKAERYIDLLETFSGHIAMAPWQRDRLFGEVRRRLAQRPDGVVRRHWGAVLHVARRVDEPER
jgi:hypothetical protein